MVVRLSFRLQLAVPAGGGTQPGFTCDDANRVSVHIMQRIFGGDIDGVRLFFRRVAAAAAARQLLVTPASPVRVHVRSLQGDGTIGGAVEISTVVPVASEAEAANAYMRSAAEMASGELGRIIAGDAQLATRVLITGGSADLTLDSSTSGIGTA